MENGVRDTDVLVVGAGPTGLALALELARRRVPHRLIDKAASPARESRAIGIQGRTLEVFDLMGIVDRFTIRGVKTHGGTIYSGGKPVVTIDFSELDSPYPYLLFLAQSETERQLTQALEQAGGRVERSVELTGLTQNSEGVTASLHLADGREETVWCRWLAGCDGAHSTVRHSLGLPFSGEEYPESFILADVRLDPGPPEDRLELHLDEAGILALFPLGTGVYRVIAELPRRKAEGEKGRRGEGEIPDARTVSIDEVQGILRERGPAGLRVTEMEWSSRFRIHRRIVSRLQEGRVFLAGDSANIHSPAGAQGMNTGIQDAFNLGWKLALVSDRRSPAELLDSYNAERYPVEAGVLRRSDLMLRVATLQAPLARRIRDRLAPALLGLGLVRQRLRGGLAELDVRYRESPIVEEHPLGGGPRAGDRAPDGPATPPGTLTPGRLYELLRTGDHTLLVFEGTESPAGETEAMRSGCLAAIKGYEPLLKIWLVRPSPGLGGEPSADAAAALDVPFLLDRDGALHRTYGAYRPCLYLLRPDGYVAFRGAVAACDSLRGYLSKLFMGG